jgi:putative sugar O-methyltransferase
MKICKVSDYNLTPDQENQWRILVNTLSEHFQKKHVSKASSWKKEEYLQFKKNNPLFSFASFITAMWQRHYDHIEKLMLDNHPQLLRDELVQYAMALSVGAVYQNKQLPYLERHWKPQRLCELLLEDPYFSPFITHERYHTSETMVNHLSHLTFYEITMQKRLQDLRCAVEFGGGYGGMARLLRRLNSKLTHITIDLPLFCFIQEHFLRSIYGENAVKLLLRETDTIEEGKINLIPIGNAPCLHQIQQAHADLFIATWSLSEANHFTQETIRNYRYFNAQHLLMGYRYYAGTVNPEQPASNSLTPTDNYSLVYNDKVFFAKDQHYLLAKRKDF